EEVAGLLALVLVERAEVGLLLLPDIEGVENDAGFEAARCDERILRLGRQRTPHLRRDGQAALPVNGVLGTSSEACHGSMRVDAAAEGGERPAPLFPTSPHRAPK